MELSYNTVPKNYRSLTSVENGEICDFLNGTKKNSAFKWVVDLARSSLPKGVLHACPYYVRNAVTNNLLTIIFAGYIKPP